MTSIQKVVNDADQSLLFTSLRQSKPANTAGYYDDDSHKIPARRVATGVIVQAVQRVIYLAKGDCVCFVSGAMRFNMNRSIFWCAKAKKNVCYVLDYANTKILHNLLILGI